MTDTDIQKSLDVIATRWPELNRKTIQDLWDSLPQGTDSSTLSAVASMLDLTLLRFRTLLPPIDVPLPEREAAADITDRLANVCLHFVTRMFASSALADNFQLLGHALAESYEANYRESRDGREPPQLTLMKQVAMSMEAMAAAAKVQEPKFKN